jgi:tyrosyl-tRNA synthetase
VGLAESAAQAYGKLMSVSDKLMWRYMQVLLHASDADIAVLQERVAAGTSHPMELKKEMAYNIIAKFWSDSDAKNAQAQFEALFQRKDYSQANAVALPAGTANPIWIVELLKLLQAVPSSSEARRLIEAGAVKVDDAVVTDAKANIAWKTDTAIKVGKHRIYKLI